MKEKFLERMLFITHKGGEIALDLIHNSSPTLKPDQSVLTKADIAVSNLARGSLKDFLDTKDHLLIDEEDKKNSEFFNSSTLASRPFVWSIDPIDGTRSFANKIPLFAISLGLLKDLKPWLGAVFFPALGELFYCDGDQSFFVKEAFTKNESSSVISCVNQPITQQSLFLGNDTLVKEFQWDFSFCHLMMSSCAAVDLCWPAVGRGVGSFFNSSLWDFVGSWPIFLSAGLSLRSLSTGQPLDRIHVELFEGKGSRTWKLREFHILSSERNFPFIKNRIISRE